MLEMLSANKATLKKTEIVREFARLLLNWWDVQGMNKFAGNRHYIKASPKTRNAIFRPPASYRGFRVVLRGETIQRVEINPKMLWRQLRTDRHLHPQMRRIPSTTFSLKWSEVGFVPTNTRPFSSPRTFGNQSIEVADREPIDDDFDEGDD
jgi:hypothetical protein